MNTRVLVAAGVAVLGVGVTRALAVPFSMNGQTYSVEHISGSGADEALLELDFGTAASSQPYLFGYEWDPATSPNGRTVLSALQSDNFGLTFTDTFYPPPSFGEYLLNTIAYKSNTPPDDYPNSYWLWFTSSNGNNWSEANFGYDGTPMTNDGFFGWGWQNSDPYPAPPAHFPAAIAAAPEPATVMFAGAGAMVLMMRRRRRGG